MTPDRLTTVAEVDEKLTTKDEIRQDMGYRSQAEWNLLIEDIKKKALKPANRAAAPIINHMVVPMLRSMDKDRFDTVRIDMMDKGIVLVTLDNTAALFTPNVKISAQPTTVKQTLYEARIEEERVARKKRAAAIPEMRKAWH